MEIPNSLRKLMQKDHETRVFVSFILKQNKELSEQVSEVKAQVQQLRDLIWKPKQQTTLPMKTGARKGHKPHNRPVPTNIHRKKSVQLTRCPDCGNLVGKTNRKRKRYVEDIRPPEPFNTEYDIHRSYCPNCKKHVEPLPNDVIPKCRFGIAFMLYATFLRYGAHLPFNKIALILKAGHGIKVSEGALIDALNRFAQYLGPEYEEIKRKVKKSATVNVDETGWRVNGENRWLWDFITKEHTLLLINKSRGTGVVEKVLGDYGGVLTTDGLATYHNVANIQQRCWVHALRFLNKGNTKSDEAKSMKNRLKRLLRDSKSGEYARIQMERRLGRILCKRYKDGWCNALVKYMNRYRKQWFTFMDYKDVDPTNNAAERGLRPSVVMRKITGGNRSEKGANNHAVIMSVTDTWEKQGKDFFTEGYNVFQRGR
jgi:transposase-like protein